MTVNVPGPEHPWFVAWQAQRLARPELEVTFAQFCEHLAALERAAGAPLALDELCVPDLYLVCGCAAADPASIATFERELAPVIERAVASFGDDARQEVKASLTAALLVDHRGRGPLLREYGGRGALRRWLRVVAVREATRLYHARRREAPTDDDALLSSLTDGGDLAAELARLDAAQAFRRAFAAALAELPPRDRTALRLHLVDGLTIDQLAPIFDVHRATAARHLAAARDAVLLGTRKHLMRALALDAAGAESLIRAARSRIDLSLERLLPSTEEGPGD